MCEDVFLQIQRKLEMREMMRAKSTELCYQGLEPIIYLMIYFNHFGMRCQNIIYAIFEVVGLSPI